MLIPMKISNYDAIAQCKMQDAEILTIIDRGFYCCFNGTNKYI